MAKIDSFRFLENELIRNLNCLNDCLAIYGALHLVRNLAKISWMLKSVCQLVKRKVDISSFGSHAVISSIERPLGRAIALNLAEKRMNLILLVGHRPDEDCREFLKLLASKGVEIITINPEQLNQAWRQLGDKNGFHERKSEAGNEPGQSGESAKNPGDDKSSQMSNQDLLHIMAKDIGILINCSDYQPDRLRRFLSYDDREMDLLIETNIVVPMKLKRLFFEKLSRRKRSMVLEVSSLAAVRPVPYLSLYSSSRRFAEHLTRSLACEHRGNVLFKTWIVTRSASCLFDTKESSKVRPLEKLAGLQTEANSEDRPTKPGLFRRLFISLLPDKQKLISSLLLSDYSYETTGHWLWALEYYLADCLPQMAVNLLLEYAFLDE